MSSGAIIAIVFGLLGLVLIIILICSIRVVKQTDKYIINTECNRFYYRYLNRRNFAYAGSVYNSYIDKGKDYKDMPDIIQLNLNENLPKYFNNQKYQYEVYDKERDEYYVDNLKIITYNIDKIVELYYNKGNHEVREGAPRYARYLISS